MGESSLCRLPLVRPTPLIVSISGTVFQHLQGIWITSISVILLLSF